MDMERVQVCCFTGHRSMDRETAERLYAVLWQVVGHLIEEGVRVFRTGGALGFDTMAAVAVLAANAVAVFRKRKSVRLFGRRVEDEVVRSAATLMGMYILLAAAGGLILSAAEKLPLGACLFESASALGTVGLSMGITPQLGALSRGVLVLLMLWGRVGGLTLMFAALSRRETEVSRCPVEKIAVG